MFQVIGDQLYYDGKLFAVISAGGPAMHGGWMLDAIDNINGRDWWPSNAVFEKLKEQSADIHRSVHTQAQTVADEAINHAIKTWWLDKSIGANMAEYIRAELQRVVNEQRAEIHSALTAEYE